MDLAAFDGKCVRITDLNGDTYDGICSYNSGEYDLHEYGCDEDGLQIEFFLFYRSDIRSVESLEDHQGLYGRFLDPYGKLEETAVEDGFDIIEEVLSSEENEHVLRMLNCLEKYLGPNSSYDLPCRDEVLGALEELLKYNKDEGIQEKAKQLLKK